MTKKAKNAPLQGEGVDRERKDTGSSRTIHRARYETKHYSFEAFGDTKVGAEAALRLGLKHHANETNIAWGWEGEDEFQFDVIVLGATYRDNERIK